MALPSIRAGLDTLRGNPLRTMLSTLGVIMGSASLVGVLSLGDGAEAMARSRVQQEGYNHILVEPITSDAVDGERIARPSVIAMTTADAEALAPIVAGRATGALSAQGSLLWTPPASTTARGLRVLGVSPLGDTLRAVAPIVEGRALTAAEARAAAPICVVSQRLATLLSAASATATPNSPDPNAAGRAAAAATPRSLSVAGRSLEIVGVQQDLMGDRGFAVVVPFAVATELLKEPVRRIVVEAARVEEVAPLQADIRKWAESHAGWGGAVRVTASGQQRLQEIERSFLWFKMLMGTFTAIALIVGGIGIMNVLLASVVERTREIGIRKAVGARRRDIRTQFLTESVAISAAGSLLGLILGLAGSFGMTALMRARTGMPMYAGLSVGTLIASASAALLVGIVFGTYPALRAARLSPVDAIQRE
jgi:putative ABC transport system permease protein